MGWKTNESSVDLHRTLPTFPLAKRLCATQHMPNYTDISNLHVGLPGTIIMKEVQNLSPTGLLPLGNEW